MDTKSQSESKYSRGVNVLTLLFIGATFIILSIGLRSNSIKIMEKLDKIDARIEKIEK